MDTNTILAIICVIILLFMLMKAYHKPTATITATKVVATKPNAYVVYTKPVYYPHYNPYKAQYYN
jgi:hypothetical protein